MSKKIPAPSTIYGRSLTYVGRSRVLLKYFHVTICGKNKGQLRGPYSYDTTLQKVGDKASVEGQLILCKNGWHAGNRRWMAGQWKCGSYRIFAVRLSGGVWCYGSKSERKAQKFIARHIEMLYEVEQRGFGRTRQFVRVTQ